MRLSTKFGATLATAALGAATVVGGAGIAQAQSSGSLGSLGSSGEAGVVLALEAADEDGANGTLVNNTETPLTCYVGVADAEAIGEAAEGAADEEDLLAYFSGLLVTADGATPALTVAAGETEEWVVTIDAEADYAAGALAYCFGADDVESFAVAYEPTGPLGSLSMGSLGS